jgi:hypothetical protein
MSAAKLDGGPTTASERPTRLVGGRAERPVRQTRIFGIPVGVDPKILVGGIILLALILFWYNSRGDEEGPSPSVVRPQQVAAPVTVPRSHIATMRRSTQANDRGTLRLKPVDATRGDIDPTLRLDLLTRLQSLEAMTGGRNLFEVGASPAQVAANAPPIVGPRVVPATPPVLPAAIPSGPPPLQIPLKFYGFVKPADKRETPRGFFMDGDDVLVATEGQLLKQKYRVVSLSATGARVEDVQLKQGQTLPVEPEAMAQ